MNHPLDIMKLAFVTGTIAVYILAFLWLAPLMGGAIVPLSILPAIAAGWLLGIRAGLLTGGLIGLLNVILFGLVTVPGEDDPLQSIPAFIIILLLGTVSGWLSDLIDQVKRQAGELEQERTFLKKEIAARKQAETALDTAHTALERQIQERTEELARVNQALQTELVERKQVESQLKARARQQVAVAELGQRALVGTNLTILMEEAVFLVAQALEVEYVKILKLIWEDNTLLLQAGVGWQEGLVGLATLEANRYAHEAGYTLRSGQPVIVTDYSRETRFKPSRLLQEHQAISGVNVIIQGQDRPFGILGVDTIKQRTFSQDDIHFLQAVANVLATMMERQQVETEISQRKQQLLALQSAGAAITSSLDLQEVLHTVAQAFSDWLGVAGCSISEWNQTDDTIVTMVDYGPGHWMKEVVGEVYRLADYPLTKRVLVERRPQQMTIGQPDIDPAELAYMQKYRITTMLILPMIFQERVVGLVEIFDDWATRTFTDQEIALGQLLANQAASAIENARLYVETQLRLAEQTALREAITAMTSTLDLETVLSHIAEQMGRVINATSAYICGYDPETMTAPVLAEYISPYASPAEQVSDLGAVYVEENNAEFLESLQLNQPSISHLDDGDLFQDEREHMQQYGAQTILYIPLQVRGQLIGYAELWESRRKREFIPEEIALCQGIAQQAAIAIENARLFEQAQQEVAERRRAEEKIKASLKEKEILLQEIHHRVKNNLQVIASLLNLQSGQVDDPQALEVFKDSQHRIRSMALIHEKLYRSENLAQIDFAEYIRDLAAYLFRVQNANAQGITLAVRADDIVLGIDTAVPCGLILNELVSNALKHAFPDDRTGKIQIELGGDSGRRLTLIVADNGIGFPEDLDFQNTNSLGLQLVNTLVNQLDGTIELTRSKGTLFKITFPKLKD